MLSFGMSPSSVDKMWQKPSLTKTLISANPHDKSLVQLGEEFYRQQLYPGERLDTLQESLMFNIHYAIEWDHIPDDVIRSPTANSKTVSLLRLCREVLVNAATKAFFGDRLLELEPNLFQTFYDFDDNSWKFTYKLPRFMSQEVHQAKEKILHTLTRYFDLPLEERPDSAWIIQILEKEMRHLGIGSSDIAPIITMTFWV